ncbi:MAG: sugar porter family MFS transporter [Ilumatobacteraceae bacterium]|nr:sugar porter family MFS transporter [Ilumatobacteraceae bacterium]
MTDIVEATEQDDGPYIFRRWAFWPALVGAVSITAGLAFGYDQGVIGGALTFMQDEFGFGSFVEGLITSWVTVGALFGALAGGALADRFSRKRALILAAYLFIIGAIVQAVAPTVLILIVGRFVIGFGVGVASVAAPMFVAESAAPDIRGRLVSGFQLAITIGILAAQFADYLLSESGTWRLMVGLAAIPGLLLLIVMTPARHSPRWLVSVGRLDDARDALSKYRGPKVDADAQIAEIEENLADEPDSNWGDLLVGGARRALVIAVGLALFQQITGINAIIYYSNEILADAGFNDASSQAGASLVAVGCVNVAATFIALAFVDRLGRRPLLIAGMAGMLLGLVGMSITFLFEAQPDNINTIVGSLSVIWMVVYVASFAFSLGPVVWTIISEVFPNHIRAKGMSLATAVNWGAAFVLTLLFPNLIDWIGNSATFAILAVFTVIAMGWTWLNVPETKGKSLEEIAQMFERDDLEARSSAGES